MNFKTAVFAVATAVATAFMPLQARTAADFFRQAPQSVLPLLALNSRLDMLDYYNSGMYTPVTNRVNGKSTLVELCDARVKVKLSENSSLELAVLPQKKDTVIAVIETVKCPVADSGIRFYRASDWTELDVQGNSLSAVDFLEPADRKKIDSNNLPRLAFSTAEFAPEKNMFIFRNTTSDFYSEDDRPAALDMMRPVMAMRFDGRKLVEVKNYKE